MPFDYATTVIPKWFKGASEDPMVSNKEVSPVLFIPENDGYAYNQMNFGNFLWGCTGSSLLVSLAIMKAGAHWNSKMNPETNDYPSQWDSKDDQFSIERGYKYSDKNGYGLKFSYPSKKTDEKKGNNSR